MGGTKTITELLLLNFLLILTPIYFYQFIITNYSAWKSRVSLGIICGAASILCMIFPIVSGTGFLWDLRWIALMMSILYGGVLAGSITALMLVVFRFSLGGLLGSVNVLVVALILLLSLLYLKKSYQRQALTGKIIRGIYFSIYSYAVVVSAIAVHFWIVGNMSFFFQHGLNVFLLMFVSYIFATSLFIYFSENIRDYSRVKEHVSQAEKGNLVSELSTLFSIDMSQTLEKAHTALNDATSQGDWVRTNHLVPIQKNLTKSTG
ncbi:LytS/YhcK type 5TM receptor domain-containing protein [Bacillus coahuilensis]|uniref:LytS/YhcK type 5TM receptor domain-containing protein n=1 Tax=Bacillus coahuilensis TaxID=408580 RepID=UPI00018506D7|nr:LytS/YhcK type 5TM receptor domain-containing protein [Bacillus coahuilensis]